ncbi:DEAD/DEAH box helicase [[Acholeplasma] multilocale]|uniref:DEAD/DEAH box helicase n=1 Tax=[Acholeplasma] multilocale TaxID=264638 RepID=UPI00068418D1|nr:DEAD/DEAH box helicase [[Acholeplasma] multilocale]
MTFKELQLNENILKALEINGFTTPTEIQEKAIPVFLNGGDLFGKSSTGTGKTASFVLPILNQLDVKLKKVQVIILAPTRELAMQIVDQTRKFGSRMNGLSIAPIIGGAKMSDQLNKLRDAQIVIGTPGRVNDHLQRGSLRLGELRTIILDEADEMLKMGFKNEIDAVFNRAPEDVQIGLFSATNTPKVMQIADNYMKDYELVEINNVMKVNTNISNTFVFTKGISKEDLILKVFEKHEPKRVIVFTNTKSNTDKIAQNLKSIGVKSVVINGDKQQSQRTRSIKAFKNNEVQVLVATDVVARGIDIDGVDFVINYDISRENEAFVHRIGRTGRNGNTGETISFIQNQGVLNQIRDIEKEFKITIDEIGYEEYGVEKTQGGFGGERSRGNRGGRNQGSRGGSYGGNSRGGSSRGGSRGGSSNGGSRGGSSRGGSRGGSSNGGSRGESSRGGSEFGRSSNGSGRNNNKSRSNSENSFSNRDRSEKPKRKGKSNSKTATGIKW